MQFPFHPPDIDDNPCNGTKGEECGKDIERFRQTCFPECRDNLDPNESDIVEPSAVIVGGAYFQSVFASRKIEERDVPRVTVADSS